MERWRKPVLGRHQLFAVDQAAMLQFLEDIDKLAAGETAQQEPAVITSRDRQRWRSIAAALAVVGARAANQPTIAVATAIKRGADMICAHRGSPHTRGASAAATQ